MMKLEKFPLCDPWFHSEVLENSAATLSGLNCTLWKGWLVHVNAVVTGVMCVEAFLKEIPLHVVMMVLLIK